MRLVSKVLRLLTVVFMLVPAFLLLGIDSTSDANGGIVTTNTNNGESTIKLAATPSRKLKGGASFVDEKKTGNRKVEVDDYGAYNPSPSFKASIRHGPIQHGTPLMPFIPKHPSPPSPPNNNPH